MNCHDAEELIARFVENELDLSLAQNLHGHVRQCFKCENTLTGLQSIGGMLRDALPVMSPANVTDAAVMSAFDQRHKRRTRSALRPSSFWRTALAPIALPRYAVVLASVIVMASVGIAFEFGRLSGSNFEPVIPAIDTDVSLTPADKASRVQFVEVPTTKIVTRLIYLTKAGRRTLDRNDKHPPNHINLNSSIAENGYVTETDLKRFQPLSAIKVRMVKGARSDEK